MIRDDAFRYIDSGLDYVYLTNGYQVEDTPYGMVYKIEAIDQLHEAIADDILSSNRPIRGQELRYLRGMLGLSQEALGAILSKSRATIAKWEGKRTEQIDETADKLLRSFYDMQMNGSELAKQLLDLFKRVDEFENGYTDDVFESQDGNWKRAA